MKKNMIALLLAAAMLLFAAAASAQTDLQALADANYLPNVLETCKSYSGTVIYYDPADGTELSSYACYGQMDDDTGAFFAFEHDTGDIEIYGRGEGYGFSADLNKPYVVGYVASGYEDEMAYLMDQNQTEVAQGQTLVSEEMGEDGMLHIVVEGPSPDYYEEGMAGIDMVYYYTVDPETLVMTACETYVKNEDGSESLYLRSTLTLGSAPYEIPQEIAALSDAETLREIHVIMDPGTEKEFDYVLEAPIDAPMAIILPDGYTLYNDAGCTQPTTYPQPDENGNYPQTFTAYASSIAE